MNKKMLKQAQQFQKDMVKMQAELETATIEATAGGGAIKAIVNGKMRLESIEIDPAVITQDDVEILQDLVIAVVNEGMDKAQELASNKMSSLTGGLNIPGLI